MPDLIVLAIPAFIILLLIEVAVSAYTKRDLFETKDTFTSLAMGSGNAILDIVGKVFIFGMYSLVYQFHIFEIEAVWWSWIILFFAEDFTYYWFHRTSHESRFFWASHVVHHSSQHYNLSTALRQTWTGSFTSFVFWLWLALVGFPPVMIMTAQAISLLYQFWIHTETIKTLGPLEWIFNTPSHHRVHHASDIKYLDRNHAGVLIIWDRMFGTFQQEEEHPTYGLTTNIESHNPIKVAFHEWVAIFTDIRKPSSIGTKFKYVFMPPGWSPDGSTMTADEMRDKMRANLDEEEKRNH